MIDHDIQQAWHERDQERAREVAKRVDAGFQAHVDQRAREEAAKSSVTLQGVAADTHRELQAAARKVEEANAVLTQAQADFRKALAAHMAAITGTKVEP